MNNTMSLPYDGSSQTQKQIIDQIQSKALRICCGAMISTPVAALQVECGEMPLQLRRREMQLRYALKLTNNQENPTSSIMNDCRQNSKTYPTGKEPFMEKTKELREIIGAPENIISDKLPKYPHWERDMLTIDTTLIQAKHNNSVVPTNQQSKASKRRGRNTKEIPEHNPNIHRWISYQKQQRHLLSDPVLKYQWQLQTIRWFIDNHGWMRCGSIRTEASE